MLNSHVLSKGQDCIVGAVPRRTQGSPSVLAPQQWQSQHPYTGDYNSVCSSPYLYLFVTDVFSFYKPKQSICWMHGRISPPLYQVPHFALDLAAQIELVTSWNLAGTSGAKCWRQLPSFLENRTGGAPKLWNWLHKRCWGCFVKACDVSEGRPVLYQTGCCWVGDLLTIYSPYPL